MSNWWVIKDKNLKLDFCLNSDANSRIKYKTITPFMKQYRCLSKEEIQQRLKKDLDYWRNHGSSY